MIHRKEPGHLSGRFRGVRYAREDRARVDEEIRLAFEFGANPIPDENALSTNVLGVDGFNCCVLRHDLGTPEAVATPARTAQRSRED